MNGTCSIVGCGRVGRLILGVCQMHDSRMRTWGHYGPPETLRPRGLSCLVDDCERPRNAYGYCGPHARRVRLYGDPLGSYQRPTGCKVANCDRTHHARGYCSLHRKRIAAHGTHVRISIRDKVWARIDERGPDECWPSTGATAKGYAHTYVMGPDGKTRHLYLHRFVYEETNGPIPPGQVIRHSCDTPGCCNPAHLLAGTQADNIADMIRRGRAKWQRVAS